MLIAYWMFIAGALLIVTTIKPPVWLGGPERRYMSDDNTNAVLNRASRRSLAGYLILAGGIFWIVGM